jgi:hypothetical protein
VLGSRIVELLHTTPLDDEHADLTAAAEAVASNGAGANGAAAAAAQQGGGEAAREALGAEVMGDESLVRLAEIVMGRVQDWDLFPADKAASKAQRVREALLDPEERERLEAQRRQLEQRGGAWPPPPPRPPQPPPGATAEDLGQGLDAFLSEGPTVFKL